jgi:hypothetical protein
MCLLVFVHAEHALNFLSTCSARRLSIQFGPFQIFTKIIQRYSKVKVNYRSQRHHETVNKKNFETESFSYLGVSDVSLFALIV